jgi:monothiol glutaredoxin
MLGNSSSFIESIVGGSDVVLFMNGVPAQPQCKPSSSMVSILHRLNAPFKPVNLLSSPNVRDSLKEFSNGPANPQLYIKGELIGGSVLVKEMYDSGALTRLLADKGVAHRPV